MKLLLIAQQVKSDCTDISNVNTISVLEKKTLFLFIKESRKKCIAFSTKILNISVFNMDNNKIASWVPNQHIRMISHTEDWSNGWWKFSFHVNKYILKYISMTNDIFYFNL